MKKILLMITAAGLLSFGSIALRDLLFSSEGLPENTHVEKVRSIVLGQEREIYIHLPPGYNPAMKYPVIYVLDGSSEDLDIANKFEVLAAAGYTPATIVVGIPNMTADNRKMQLVPPFMKVDHEDPGSASGHADRFLDFIESELVPFVERKYSASGYRSLSGFSRGGLLVMYSMIYKPPLFSARYCYSTPFWREKDLLTQKVEDFFRSHDSLGGFLYISCGENETANIKSGTAKMTDVFRKHAPKNLTWFSEVTPGAGHHNNSHLSASRAIRRWTDHVNSAHLAKTHEPSGVMQHTVVE